MSKRIGLGRKSKAEWAAFYGETTGPDPAEDGNDHVLVKIPKLQVVLRAVSSLVQSPGEDPNEGLGDWLIGVPDSLELIGANAHFQELHAEEADTWASWDGFWLGATSAPVPSSSLTEMTKALEIWLVPHAWCRVLHTRAGRSHSRDGSPFNPRGSRPEAKPNSRPAPSEGPRGSSSQEGQGSLARSSAQSLSHLFSEGTSPGLEDEENRLNDKKY